MSQFNYKDIIEGQLPQDLYKSKDLESQAIGNSLDKLQNDVDRLENDVNPLTAINKGLHQWEGFFKLHSNIEDSIETRRARVISELIQFMSDENVIRKDEMESILGLFANEVEVVEHFADYVFDVVYRGIEVLNINEISKIIKKIKPSWLEYKLVIERKREMNLYLGITHRQLKTSTFKAYQIKDFEVENNLNIGIASRKAKSMHFDINNIEDIEIVGSKYFVGVCRRFKEIQMEVEHV